MGDIGRLKLCQSNNLQNLAKLHPKLGIKNKLRIKAGYSERPATMQGSRMMSNDKIEKYIHDRTG
ncbi:MAG: hypothetical protein C0433_14405 [Cyclobacterium sp.]|nr:hypothetical protein [Cyclobacterium sp.]